MAETPTAPATTAPSDFIVPNQDLIEQVIDARLAAHAENESSSKKSSASRTSAKASDDSKKSDESAKTS